MSLKEKALSSFTWSFIDNAANKIVGFVIGIILARLLMPKEFGLVGMITVFIAISQSFVESGFGEALIRKNNCTDKDYSTIFYFNLIVGVLFFWILFFSANAISKFYNEPQLVRIVQVLGIVLIINAITTIQRTILTKRLDFKLQTKISFIAAMSSGLIAIAMAYKGFGVWSLVAQTICRSVVNSALLWAWNKWRPILVFSKSSFIELFSFGYKLLLSGLLNTAWKNIYTLVIGKFFSAETLGFYSRAKQFKELPSSNITAIISRVSYPVLAQMQDNPIKMKMAYKKLIKTTMLITFVLMMGMAAIAEPMVITLIGEHWRTSVVYLQLICFVGMMYPLQALNLNMLNVKGRSDLFLKLEIYKKFLAVPALIIGIYYGIEIMLALGIVTTWITYYINSYWSGKLINYPMKEQVLDILPSFFIAMVIAAIVFLIGWLMPIGYFPKLIIQLASGIILFIILCELTKIDAYVTLKEIVINGLGDFRNKR
jgi:teichuronic acid exporter